MGFYLKYYRNKTGQSTITIQKRRRAATYTYAPTYTPMTFMPTYAPTYTPITYMPVYTTTTPPKTTKSQTNKYKKNYKKSYKK